MASSSSVAATPPWEKLPTEITAAILHKLGAVEILTTAQKVCPTWWRVSRDPSMWRCIDMQISPGGNRRPYNFEKMCRHAVDLSQGQLIDIQIGCFGTNELLLYISQRSSQMRRLKIVGCNSRTIDGLKEAIKNFPLLEELHLEYTHISMEAIENIGRFCPLLKSFTFIDQYILPLFMHPMNVDREALAIAENMPGLRHLRLIGSQMTNEGLKAILEGCPNLESLDLRQCFGVKLDGSLGKLCAERIKDLKLPCDPMDETYHSSAEIYGFKMFDILDLINGFTDDGGYDDYEFY